MKIKIEKDGSLLISRGKNEKLKKLVCPYSRDGGIKGYCGDWCPKFSEYFKDSFFDVVISTCDTKHVCILQDFTDERV